MKALRRMLGAVAIFVVFVSALVVGVLLHIDAPVTRRVAVHEVNGALAPMFKGTVKITNLNHVSNGGIEGADVEIRSPNADRVVVAHGIRARTNGIAIATSALFGTGPIAVSIDEASIDDADVALDASEDGRLWLEQTFEPRTKAPPSPPGRGVKLTIARVIVKHAWIHRPGLDADADAVLGTMTVVSSPTPKVEIDVSHVAAKTRGMPARIDPAGDVSKVQIRMPGSKGDGVLVAATFEGRAADVPVTVVAKMDGAYVTASVTAPRAPAAKVRAIVPGLPLEEDVVGLSADAHGALPSLAANVTFALANGRGTVAVTSDLFLDAAPHGNAVVAVTGIDARAFVATAPETHLGAKATASFTVAKTGAIDVEYTVDQDGGTIAGQKIPPSSIAGTVSKNAAGVVVTGKGHVDEDGAPTDITLALRSNILSVTTDTKIPRLDRVARVGPIATGSAQATSRIAVRLDDKTFDVVATAHLQKLAKGDLRMDRGLLQAHVWGPFASPEIYATLTAEDVEGGGAAYPQVKVLATGNALTPHVVADLGGDAQAELRASADVDVKTTTLRNPRLEAKRGHTNIVASASTVRIAGGEVKVENAVVEGLGEPVHATVSASSNQIVVRTKAKGIPLARVAHLAGLQKDVKSGTVDLDVDLVVDPKGAHGHVLADLTGGTFGKYEDLDAHVDAKLDGRNVQGTVHAALGAVGSVDVKTDNLTIGEAGPLRLDAWKKGFGRIDLDARIDLAKVLPLLPPDSVPVKELSGFLVIKGSAARDGQTDFTPALEITASTESLVVVRPNGDRIAGIDLGATAKIDGDSGVATIASHAADGLGTFVTVDARSDAIPYPELFTGVGIPDRLSRTPFTAKIGIPARDIAKLPAGLAVQGLKGDVDAVVDIEGTARTPKIHVVASAKSLVAESSPLSFPIDAAIDGHYDGAVFDVTLETRSKRGPVANGTGHVDAKIDDLFAGRTLAWTGRANVKLLGFPLNRIAPLGDRGIRGTATGDVAIEGLHTADPHATADLSIASVEIDAIKYNGVKLVATLDRSLSATVRVDQSDGSLDAKADAGIVWTDGIVPGPDLTRPLEASITAKNARMSMFHPFIDDVFSELEGRLDGSAHASLAPGQGAKVEGAIALTDGLVQVASTGTELHDVKAKLSLASDGTVRVDDVSAKGASGKLTASALAHLDGTSVKDANGKLEIPKSDPIPLDLEGVQMGDVYGTFKMRAKRSVTDPKQLDIDVDVPTLHVSVPTSLSHPVRELDAPSNIHVGVVPKGENAQFSKISLGAPQETKIASKSGSITVLAVHLLEDIVVTRGQMLRVNLEGDPTVRFSDDGTSVSGQIRLSRGTLEVQSKKFEIEKGTVTFVGSDAGNPSVVVSAGWTAPDGTRVYADFVGPLKTGKVTLRSEPARPKSEILALILFGGAEGSAATPYASKSGGAGSTATSAAGNVAAGGLAQGLDQLTGIDVAAKVDTSNPSNPRPEVEVQIAQSISLQIAYILGTPPPGTNPDKTFLTIDWRFLRRWSLQATRGDLGSSFADIVWQYRY